MQYRMCHIYTPIEKQLIFKYNIMKLIKNEEDCFCLILTEYQREQES